MDAPVKTATLNNEKAKALQAAGARVVLASHPRVVGIVESFLSRDMDAESRKLPYVGGELKVEKVYALDARFDTMADVDDAIHLDADAGDVGAEGGD